MDALTDDLIDALVEHDRARPTPESVIFIRTLGGAVSRVDPSDTAYPHRAAAFNVSIDASWHDPTLDEASLGWVRSTWDALLPFSTGGVYLNFAGLGEAPGMRDAALGENKARIDEIRAMYDPHGLFDRAARQP